MCSHYIFTIPMLMVARLIRAVIYSKKSSPVNLHDSSRKWSYEVTWQFKYIISILKKDYEHQTNQGSDLQWESPVLKATWPLDNVNQCEVKTFYIYYHKTGKVLTRKRRLGRQVFKSSSTSSWMLRLILIFKTSVDNWFWIYQNINCHKVSVSELIISKSYIDVGPGGRSKLFFPTHTN